MSNKSSSKPISSQPVGKSTRYEEIRNGSGYKDNSNWSYVNILDTKSQTFLCCTSS